MRELEIVSGERWQIISDAWHSDLIGAQNPPSPFYRREFFEILAQHRPDLRFGLVREDGRVESILPIQPGPMGVAYPAGFPLCDYQGVIGADVDAATLVAILKRAGVGEFFFNHVPTQQAAFAEYTQLLSGSPVIDTRLPYAEYVAQLKQRSGEYSQSARKLRAMEREIGPIGFQPLSQDPANLRLLISWKSDQYRRTGAPDVFHEAWIRGVVESTFRCNDTDFRGALSVLTAGERPVAIHHGLMAGGVWHYWFPAYDPEFSRYSPGLNLLLKMIQYATECGIEWIDLGRGQDVRYKNLLKTSEVPLREGLVVSSKLSWYLDIARRAIGRLRRTIR